MSPETRSLLRDANEETRLSTEAFVKQALEDFGLSNVTAYKVQYMGELLDGRSYELVFWFATVPNVRIAIEPQSRKRKENYHASPGAGFEDIFYFTPNEIGNNSPEALEKMKEVYALVKESIFRSPDRSQG